MNYLKLIKFVLDKNPPKLKILLKFLKKDHQKKLIQKKKIKLKKLNCKMVILMFQQQNNQNNFNQLQKILIKFKQKNKKEKKI